VSEHEPTIDLPAAPEAVAAPPFAAPPGERVPDFTLDRPRDPEWYRRAVFYEVLIRGFQDANGDGTGDLRGLTSRLDYLQWLGIDCR
jgi:maltose alpha-D-glucosyltransferase/alpha-amylase